MENNKQRWNKSKVLYVVLSVLFSCAIWLYVDSINNPEKEKTISDIPIEYVGSDTILADRGLMLLPESDQTMTLTIKARRLILAKLDPDKIRIQANLSDITETGAHNVGYTVRYPSNIPRDAVSYSNASYAAHVEIGELYRRNVDIRCTLTGTVAEGYIAGELRLEPETLELRGPRTEVDAVAYAKVTLAVDNATETVSKALDYELYNEAGELIEDTSNLRATSDQIQVTLPVNVEKELPLRVNFIETAGARVQNLDYSITPASITVSGAAELLKDVEYITLDDFELAEFVGPSTYRYTINVPAGCENLSGAARATMTVRFKDMASADFNAVNFTCENVPEGKTVTVLTAELPVSLRGTAADVASVKAEDITVTADLTDILAAGGSYTVPAKVIVGNGADVGVVGEYQVKITISEDTGQEETPDPTVP
ncbi:CdaR family protein [Oscillibacter sp.]|uniref:CdaR family protein n=1 Tax=Oscillibacter sp. TaxID=1945593 RepID=UPI00289DFD7B|nr:CdaR family protein [Oscillibacter sp.]